MSRDDVAVCVPIDPLFVGSSCQDKQFGTLGIKRKSCCTAAGRFGCACKGCKGDVRFGAMADLSLNLASVFDASGATSTGLT